jgi:hypothetical protein
MRWLNMRWKDKFQAILGFIFLIAVAGALYGWPDKLVATIMEWGVSMLVAVVLSGISGEIVERFTGDALKNISLTVEIAGVNFSITLFVIATLIVRLVLF